METTEGLEETPADAPHESIQVELERGKTLNINLNLSESQKEELIDILWRHKEAFAMGYEDMNGILSNLFTHHIYIKEDYHPIRQPQRRMNMTLKNVVKE